MHSEINVRTQNYIPLINGRDRGMLRGSVVDRADGIAEGTQDIRYAGAFRRQDNRHTKFVVKSARGRGFGPRD
jgi:hypothetical protein